MIDFGAERPTNLAVEKVLLGTLLVYPERIKNKEFELLTPDDFGAESHRRIYQALVAAADEDRFFELSPVEMQSVGGAEYVSSLIDGAVDRPTLESYVRKLKETALRQKIEVTCRRASLAAQDLANGSYEIIDRTIESLEDLRAAEPCANVLAPWSEFTWHSSGQIDWLVDGVIEVGTNGFILGPPKSRKSWAAEALAVSLISGQPWFGQKVRRRRVALVSREDHAATTARRIKQIMRGKDIDPSSKWVDDCFWFNSRAETQQLLLTESAALRSLISNLNLRQVEFLILDVLGVLHEGDENEVREMRAVLRCVERLAGEVGCQVCIVHHARKGCEWSDTLSNWARGSSVIAGFAEFLIGCMVEDEEKGVVHTKFDSKADAAIPPFYWRIEPFPERKALELNRLPDYQPKKGRQKENLF